MYDENKVKDYIQVGFGKLYTSEKCMSLARSPTFSFSCCFLFEEEKSWIGREVTSEDIRHELSTLKPFKAPGPNGLHAGFF